MNIKELKELIKNIDDDVIVSVEWLGKWVKDKDGKPSQSSRMGVVDIAYVIHDEEEKPNYYFMLTHSEAIHSQKGGN